jgi:hypothetical protein
MTNLRPCQRFHPMLASVSNEVCNPPKNIFLHNFDQPKPGSHHQFVYLLVQPPMAAGVYKAVNAREHATIREIPPRRLGRTWGTTPPWQHRSARSRRRVAVRPSAHLAGAGAILKAGRPAVEGDSREHRLGIGKSQSVKQIQAIFTPANDPQKDRIVVTVVVTFGRFFTQVVE